MENRNEAVRDLEWVLHSSDLLNPAHPDFESKLLTDAWCRELLEKSRPELRKLNAEPTLLEAYLNAYLGKGALLGRYFEALLSFWIEEFLRPEVFYSSVAVHESQISDLKAGRKTLGEFDFLFRLSQDSVAEHWESAVKFYLCAAQDKAEAVQSRFFVGAHTRDRLDLKIDRIFQHQLKLEQSPEGRNELSELEFGPVRPMAFVKGMLFYPSDSDWRNSPHPAEVSENHERGWWSSADRLEIPKASDQSRWVVLSKHRWLSKAEFWQEDDTHLPGHLPGHMPGMSFDQISEFCRTHFDQHLAPLMLAEIEPIGEVPGRKYEILWREKQRGMVVFSDWRSAARQAVQV